MDGRLNELEVIHATDGRNDLESLAREFALEQAASVEHAGFLADREAFVESIRDLVMERVQGVLSQRPLPLSDPRLHEPFDVSNRLASSRA